MASGKTYYARALSGTRLRECYDLTPPRVRQYLDAEIEFVRRKIDARMVVLELGCGYGRVAGPLAEVARRVIGIDTAVESLRLALRTNAAHGRCTYAAMDATRLGFGPGVFDLVVCVQNGLCAFQVDPANVLREALRVTRHGGRILTSTYAERFWPHRLEWFETQAAHGLIGAIDREVTRDGVIACKDGFRAGMLSPSQFADLCGGLGVQGRTVEVDESSLFCEIQVS